MDTDRFNTTTLNEAENRFQAAMLDNDVSALDAFLHDEVRFTGPDGSTIDKAADLAVHRSRTLLLSEIDELGREVQVIGGIGVTRVTLRVVGTLAGDKIEATMAYTRTWIPADNGWVIAAAHGSLVAP
ncbi:nuclear transport factor 2 family protein [Actinorhabdospora filicis]|nr:nuclear transport factor 2 family protein [Actinorhabdospora filicis]